MPPPRHVPRAQGPFRADQLRSGDPYELADGHPSACLPSAGRGGSAQGFGAVVVLNDPAVESGGVEIGFSPRPDMLRAPDVAVGGVTEGPGWVRGVPSLALEYADTGQDEDDLQRKIGELLAEGTRLIWVVRLVGPRRVEIHERERPMRIATVGEELIAPGILANPVPVLALFDRQEARRVDLRNLLQRFGYQSIEALRAEGKAEGLAEGKRGALLAMLAARGIPLPDALRDRIVACRSLAQFDDWIARAAVCASADELG